MVGLLKKLMIDRAISLLIKKPRCLKQFFTFLLLIASFFDFPVPFNVEGIFFALFPLSPPFFLLPSVSLLYSRFLLKPLSLSTSSGDFLLFSFFPPFLTSPFLKKNNLIFFKSFRFLVTLLLKLLSLLTLKGYFLLFFPCLPLSFCFLPFLSYIAALF